MNDEYIFENLKTKIAGKYDVIVVGGGPAGCAAAISSARAGVKTLLIEKNNCLGGMWTSGFVNPLFDFANKKGLLEEIIGKLKDKSAWGGFWDMSFNYEYMKNILENLCIDAGVKILFNTYYAGVIKADNAVKGVIVENIEGRSAFTASVVIDASGDACVAADAGAVIHIGDETDHRCQAMTLMFLLGNVNPKFYKEGLMFFDNLKKAYEKDGKNKTVPYEKPFLIPIPGTNFAAVQMTHMRGINPLSEEDITKATIEGRKQAIDAFEALKKYDDDFSGIDLIQTAPMMGIRESRRIEGEYTVTIDDLDNGTQFYDGITTVTFCVDIHEDGVESQTVKGVTPYQIPYRSLIPKGIDNLLVAGRCISGTHEAMASYRVTGDCCAMGEAAGNAAAVAIQKSINLRDV
ncbi:MAG: FAD-dependent oxidoreductase [Saccharofermentanales bacterium]